MNEYHPDIFYNTHDLDLYTSIQIFNDAKRVAYKWWVDELDCSKSFARQKIDMSFEDAMKKFTKASFFNVIHRRGYSDHCGEISYRTGRINEPDYFLWVCIDENELQKLVGKYNLKKYE